MLHFISAEDLLKYLDEHSVEQIDVKFCDLVGSFHHITLLRRSVDSRILEKGVGFDSSSVPRFRDVSRGDMAVKPDLNAGFLDPSWDRPTLSLLGNIVEAGTGAEVSLDPRTVLSKAVKFMKESGIADSFDCAPELEYYIFRDAQFRNERLGAFYQLRVEDGSAEKVKKGAGYLTDGPQDAWRSLRAEMASKMIGAGLPVRYHHAEVGEAGQQEIELGFSPALEAADGIMLGKYLVRSVATRHDVDVCFLPKPIADAAGNGMHIHFRLFKGGENLFAETDSLSRLGQNFIGGILRHGRALLAIMSPTLNSYRRLRPGHETPTRFFFSTANREAAIRIPSYSVGKHIRCEFRPGDATMNPYLGIAAMLMAGLDGVKNAIDPTSRHLGPFDGPPPPVDMAKYPECFLPRSLDEALRALEDDQEFLTSGGVFDKLLITNFLSYKRDELYAMSASPTPLEFEMYWGI